MSVEENIAFPLIEHTLLSRAERKDRVAEVLEAVDLAGVQPKLPSQLSGGQRKRVAIARALVLKPPVILFDEPTTGLDPIRSAGIDDVITKLRDSVGVTNIVVTHDLTSARHVADRVVMLMGGIVVADGPFDDLAKSSNHCVQNFLTGTYDKDDDNVMTETKAHQRRPLR
jgi:phospholipid/cholesterol/gamma-HCH transport system ATP-binding protein